MQNIKYSTYDFHILDIDDDRLWEDDTYTL